MNAPQPVVVGFDFSAGAEAALVRAADFAERLHAPLHLLHAVGLLREERTFREDGRAQTKDVPPTDGIDGSCPISFEEPSNTQEPDDVEQRMRAFARDALGIEAAISLILAIRRTGSAVDAISRYASEVGADFIVVGTHGRRGLRHLLVGSVAEGVVRHAPCPVLVVPNAAVRTTPSPAAPILVPVDFTEHDRTALAAARRLAAAFSAPIELVHVRRSLSTLPSFYDDATGFATVFDVVPGVSKGAEARLRRFDAAISEEPAAAYHVLSGHPAQEIAALAKKRNVGLVVMATHARIGQASTRRRSSFRWPPVYGKALASGRALASSIVPASSPAPASRVAPVFMGRVTEEMLRRAPCPVLTLQ